MLRRKWVFADKRTALLLLDGPHPNRCTHLWYFAYFAWTGAQVPFITFASYYSGIYLSKRGEILPCFSSVSPLHQLSRD